MERLVDLTFDCTDEMGTPRQKHLILELMGRNLEPHPDGRRRGASSTACGAWILKCPTERQVLPGLYYHQPPRQDKQEIFGQTPESVFALLQGWHRGPAVRQMAAGHVRRHLAAGRAER